METPITSHLTNNIKFCNVYEPAEDTFLLLDALEYEIDFIDSQRPTLCLEVGSGSGAVITAVSKHFGASAVCMSTDINMSACKATLMTADHNSAIVEAVNMDLVSCFHPRLHGIVDLLIFNPPYVVTPSEEVGSLGISASWAGGINGRQVIDRVLPEIRNLLSKHGLFYMVIIKENNIDDISNIMRTQGFNTNVVMTRRTGPELLSVLRFERIS